MCVCMYVHIYIYIYICIHILTCIRDKGPCHTVSSHNFDSHSLMLRVSNPRIICLCSRQNAFRKSKSSRGFVHFSRLNLSENWPYSMLVSLVCIFQFLCLCCYPKTWIPRTKYMGVPCHMGMRQSTFVCVIRNLG